MEILQTDILRHKNNSYSFCPFLRPWHAYIHEYTIMYYRYIKQTKPGYCATLLAALRHKYDFYQKHIAAMNELESRDWWKYMKA